MSFHYPRRVKDLPTLEDESDEDYNTPQKPRNIVNTQNNYNKENVQQNSTNKSNKTAAILSNMRMYPKRRSELPTLESDSEEEEYIKNDNLNCAILNDSFMLSPSKSEQDESIISVRSSSESSAIKAKNETNASLISCFNNMALDGVSKHTSTQSNSLLSIPVDHKPVDSKSIGNVESIATQITKATIVKESANNKDLETPIRTNIIDSTAKSRHNATNNVESSHFVTPQVCVRSFSVQHSRHGLGLTQTQKSRTAVPSEIRSQKVLFQTPMAVARAPIHCLTNDSLTLSLCDTINEGSETPCSAEQPVVSNEKHNDASGKSKKSLESAFLEVDKDNVQKIEVDTTTENNPTNSNTNVLHINNVDYVMLQKLGSGGSSSVYLARRTADRKECALKIVDLRGDPAVVEGYLNETKLLAKLQGDFSVVELFDYQLLRKESKLFMVMEKGDSDLHKILQSYSTNLPLYTLISYLHQMLEAVNYIHQNGVIHSDLKPANFLMVNGRLKLIDFGIASNIAIDSTSIIKFSQAGTFNYISPEALTDTSTGSSPIRSNQPKIKISTKSDVWSLGCILYLLLYQRTPFSHIKNIYAKISAISNPVTEINYPQLQNFYPAMLLYMVKNCLQHNPKKRPSCAELLKYPFDMIVPKEYLTKPIT